MPIKKEGKRIQITLADNIFELLEKYTNKNGVSRSALISIALNEKLEKLEREEAEKK
jgi:metal-responsive CopG/Arc/MetJ family transcriptional regulator